MNGDPSADEIHLKIQAGSKAWRDIIPLDRHAMFVERVQQAVDIYLGLVSPKDLRDELEKFEKATRSSTAPISQLVSDLSADAQSILAGTGQLPFPPPDGAAEQGYYNDIRSRLIRAQRWLPEGAKRRWQTEIVGPAKKMGRPSDARIDVLVSFICAAYADATSKPASRSWSESVKSDVEKIVEDCLANLCIDDRHNAKKAVQRHVGNRNLLD